MKKKRNKYDRLIDSIIESLLVIKKLLARGVA